MEFDKTSRLFHVVLTDGTLATVTIYRDEAVTAWSLQTTQGAFRSVAVVGDRVCFLMERAGGFFVEVFDPGLFVDCGLTGTRTPATATWSGLGHLEGQWVTVLADGVALPGTKKVAGGSVTIDRAAKTVAIGLSYTHVIEPLPPVIEGRPMLGRLRPLSITVRLRSTGAMCIDTGKGRSYVPLASSIGGSPSLGPELYSGDKRIRVAGWRQGQVDALWRIEQEVPLPLTLLLVTVDLSIND
jgi:hypothetical protein